MGKATKHKVNVTGNPSIGEWDCPFCGKPFPLYEDRVLIAAYREAAAIIEAVSPRDGMALNIRTVLHDMGAAVA